MGTGISNFGLCQSKEDPKPWDGAIAFGYVRKTF